MPKLLDSKEVARLTAILESGANEKLKMAAAAKVEGLAEAKGGGHGDEVGRS